LGIELLTLTSRLAQRGPQAGRAVAGQPYETGLLVEGPADGLADPEGCVRGELEASAPVELVDGMLEAEVALLDEVEEIHPLGEGVAPCDGDHQAKVGPDEPVLGTVGSGDGSLEVGGGFASVDAGGCLAAGLDLARQLLLLISGEERNLADL